MSAREHGCELGRLITVVWLVSLLSRSTHGEVIAHWSFEKDSAFIYEDVTGNGYDAVGTAYEGSEPGLSLAPGVKGKALECLEKDYMIEVSNSMEGFTVPQFSIEAWFYSYIDLVDVGSFWNFKSIFQHTSENVTGHGASNPGGYALHIDDSGYLLFGMVRTKGSGTWAHIYTSGTVPEPRTWYHLVASYDAEELRIYLNGELIKSSPYDGGYVPPYHNAHIAGQYLTDGTMRNWFSGRLDEMKLYDHALHPDTVMTHYEALAPAGEAPFEINIGMKASYAQPGDRLWVPLFVANHEEFEISACQFSVSFDTSVVQLLEISTDSGLARDWMMTHGDLQSDSVMVAMGGGTASLGYGEGELVRFLFEVGSEAPDGAVSTLELGDVEVDEANGLVVATTNAGRIIVESVDILYGDVTGNERVNAFDAQKILEYVVGNLTIPDPSVPDFNMVVADVSANGNITSYDAALVFQYSVGLLPCFPVEAADRSMRKARNVNATLSSAAMLALVMDSEENPAELVIDLVGRNINDYLAGEFGIRCDPAVVDLDKPGDFSSTVRGHTLNSSLDKDSSLIKLAMTTSDDIDVADSITLVRMIVPRTGAALHDSALVLESALINEGRIESNIISEPLSPVEKKASFARRFSGEPGLAARLSGNRLHIRGFYGRGCTVTLFDMTGRVVYRKRLTQREAGITLPWSTRGIYLYRITAGSRSFSDRIIVK